MLGQVLAEVDIARLPAAAAAWVAQATTHHLGAGLLGKLGDGFGVGGVRDLNQVQASRSQSTCP